jgi:hypothetical protein
MPVRLSITVSKITSLPNSTNAALMTEFYHYMKNNGASESHTNNSLKTNMAFAKFLGPDVTFYVIGNLMLWMHSFHHPATIYYLSNTVNHRLAACH